MLKCLLNVMSTFNGREPYYLLNRFYVSDYAVFVQLVPDARLASLAQALRLVSFSDFSSCFFERVREFRRSALAIDRSIVESVRRVELSSRPADRLRCETCTIRRFSLVVAPDLAEYFFHTS